MSIEEFPVPRRARGARAAVLQSDPLDCDKQLREQAGRLAATYEHAGVGIIEVDATGKILRLNAQACAFLGAPPAELLGLSIFDPAYTDDAAADLAQFCRQTAGEIDRYVID